MIDSHFQKLTDKVAREYDELVKSCFEFVGFDEDYLRRHLDEFWRELYPEGRCTYYHDKTPLFTVIQKVDLDLENHKAIVTHEVAWHLPEEGGSSCLKNS